ncbi:putative peptidase family-domain-containing protein [Lophiotrema nucula]|uniref:Putative peptidase family-domain-containing protein n=1 Tax=Lophiotrema nucula TaxID=690887 RepID=A0A6A5Z7C8_9PLEO|nr:putative peptidase family-domain-containing protein [Lophiotrema nucula]
MFVLQSLLLLLGAASVLASPARLVARQTVTVTEVVNTPAASSRPWNAGAVTEYPIHSSCNLTERAQLKRALGEAEALARHAADHILRWGNSSDIYKKYFGSASIAEPIGWFENVVAGDKAGALFRCDNPDGNCEQKGWGGHWRGENASSETVICPLSYSTRRPLEAMCGFGYEVANGATNFYFASDLLHRLYHVPKVGGYGIVEHYAGEYDECLDLAKTNPEEAVRNSDSLQYFALEVYAYDIAIPGEGCPGKWTATSSAAVASHKATSAGGVSSQTYVPTATMSEVVSVTSTAAQECHTHADGTEHSTHATHDATHL